MTTYRPEIMLDTRRGILLFIIPLIVLSAVGVLLGVGTRQPSQSRMAEVAHAVRASFPHFCVSGLLIIDLSTDRPDRSVATPGPDQYLIGCDATQAKFGYAFELNISTCEMIFTSLTLVSEFINQMPPGSPSKMPVCPVIDH